MSSIKFSVHRNPLKDSEGRDTYQVRHENWYTMQKEELLEHLQHHGLMRPELMDSALTVLARELVEQLTDNKRVHLDGLGTFYLKVGFRPRYDEQGVEIKPHFTDPKEITGNDVQIETIGFTPDQEFLKLLNDSAYSFENLTGRGRVGHTKHYSDEDFLKKLNAYIDEHSYITRPLLISEFGLTDHMARKWLERLTTQPLALLKAEKVGNTIVFKRH